MHIQCTIHAVHAVHAVLYMLCIPYEEALCVSSDAVAASQDLFQETAPQDTDTLDQVHVHIHYSIIYNHQHSD